MPDPEPTPPSVLVVADPHSFEHRPPNDHPESVDRLDAVHRGLAQVDGIETVPSRAAESYELEAVHQTSLITRVRAMSDAGGGWVDEDTYISSGTYEAALYGAGAGLVAVDALTADPTLTSAFVVTRPPGHHATAANPMGFCFFNNVAVTAAQLLSRGDRVVILDWDVHHGNGTQDIFWDESAVLYISIHQEILYPGTGLTHERGPTPGHRSTANLPMPGGATGDRYLSLLDHVVTPLVERFDPDWILVSCGFDAHVNDPLADMALEADDFALLTERVTKWAPEPGRLVLFLEGGYDLDAVEASTAAVLKTLTGAERPQPSATTGGPGAERVAEFRELWDLE
jgi:acetoin utilization deacetylase AcuC-like enzyme